VDLFTNLPFQDDDNIVDDVEDDTKESKRQTPPTSSDTGPSTPQSYKKGLDSGTLILIVFGIKY
jgi:hypothetical protein